MRTLGPDVNTILTPIHADCLSFYLALSGLICDIFVLYAGLHPALIYSTPSGLGRDFTNLCVAAFVEPGSIVIRKIVPQSNYLFKQIL